VEIGGPFGVLLLGNDPVSETEGSKSIVGEVLEIGVGLLLHLLLPRRESLEDDVVGSLDEEEDLVVVVHLPKNDRHPLPGGRELEDVEELVLVDLVGEGSLKSKDVSISTSEDESNVGGGLNAGEKMEEKGERVVAKSAKRERDASKRESRRR